MQVTEIYRSIQGESSFAGLPCIFVRLTGCNLRCHWCDSEYTFSGGNRMSLDEVLREIDRLGTVKLVEITGGEPMLQAREVVPLMEQLLALDYQVLLETSGERPLDRVPAQVVKIVDVKCPHSGEADTFRVSNLKTLNPQDELKFVISDRLDYEFARDFFHEHQLRVQVRNVIFSPAFHKNAQGTRDASHCMVDPRELAEWILEDELPVRLGLQIHKFIWQPEMKGV